MANGRCRMHGGATPKGRHHGAFRTGQFTAESIADRKGAKSLRQLSMQAWLKAFRSKNIIGRAVRDGLITQEQADEARKVLDGEMNRADAMRQEAFRLQFSWLDRYWPPRRKRRSKKEPAK
jgi:hypothetical protein